MSHQRMKNTFLSPSHNKIITSLSLAVEKRDVNAVKSIISTLDKLKPEEAKEILSIKNDRNDTIIHTAIRYIDDDSTEIVVLLIKAYQKFGLDLNIVGKYDETPLQRCLMMSEYINKNVVKMFNTLLHAGANWEIPHRRDYNVYQYAKACGLRELVKAIDEYKKSTEIKASIQPDSNASQVQPTPEKASNAPVTKKLFRMRDRS